MIHDLPVDHVYSVTINQNTNPRGVDVIPVKVNIVSLETYFVRRNIQGLDLMKIDVETHEPEVLLGALELVRKFRPAMIVEILNAAVAMRLDIIFRSLDYEVYFIDDRKGNVVPTFLASCKDFGNFLVCTEGHSAYLRKVIAKFG